MKKLAALVMVALALMLAASAALADNPFAGMTYFEAGQYKVGLDMPADEYVLLSTGDYGGYFAITSDANGSNIITNDIFDTNSIVTVNYGEYVELSRCVAIKASDFYSEYTIRTDRTGVMLKVGYGYDIMPGEYKVIPESGKSGYYCIYNDSRHDHIVTNDIFDGSRYVYVQNGQYLVLDRCYIQQ